MLVVEDKSVVVDTLVAVFQDVEVVELVADLVGLALVLDELVAVFLLVFQAVEVAVLDNLDVLVEMAVMVDLAFDLVSVLLVDHLNNKNSH